GGAKRRRDTPRAYTSAPPPPARSTPRSTGSGDPGRRRWRVLRNDVPDVPGGHPEPAPPDEGGPRARPRPGARADAATLRRGGTVSHTKQSVFIVDDDRLQTLFLGEALR